MRKPIFANQEHEVIIGKYTHFMKECIRDLSNDIRWKNYLDVYDIVIEYHNNYGAGVKENNFWDWVMILPINLSVLTNGYLAAMETKRNAALIRSYKLLLNELLQDTVDKIEKLEPINE